MSQRIQITNLAGAAIGQVFTVPISQQMFAGSIEQRGSGNVPHLVLYNESGCELLMHFKVSGDEFTLPAGGWLIGFGLDPEEVGFIATVDAILPNAPIAKLYGDLYAPWEQVTAARVLGNSPIGLSAVTLPVTQVIQDGQPNGQIIVEATPTGQPQNVLITTDGGATFGASGLGAVNVAGDVLISSARASNTSLFKILQQVASVAFGFTFQFWNGSTLLNILSLGGRFGAANTWLDQFGAIGGINGQATVGSFGVAPVVAQSPITTVTVTTVQTILTYSVPVAGRYRISYTLIIGNTASSTPTLEAFFTNGAGNTNDAMFFSAAGATPNSGKVTHMDNGSTTFTANWGSADGVPICVDLGVGTLTVKYTAGSGAPNDRVSVIVERLS